MVSAPAPNADFIAFIFQGSKTGSAVSTFKGMLALQRGPKKIDFFSIFVQLKSACSDQTDGLLSEIEIVMSPQFVGFSARKSPFQGGRLPRGSKLVVHKF